MALKNKRIMDLAGVLEHLGIHEIKPTEVRVVTGAKLLEFVRVAFHIGKDIGARDVPRVDRERS